MRYSDNAPVWVEKYRPRTIDDCILPESIKNTFKGVIDSGTLSNNYILHGKAGVGKTTIARAACNELGISPLFVNAAKDGNIDVLRTKVQDYCSTKSFDGTRKCVILDEADRLSGATQEALKAFIEEFSCNASFFFTANNIGKIIEPLYSRSAMIEFKIPRNEISSLARQFHKRLKWILERESVEYEDKVLVELIKKHFPDFRRVINETQRYSSNGKIDVGILSQVKDASIEDLVVSLKNDDFQSMRKWCAVNTEGDTVKIMRKLYDQVYDIFAPACIPEITLILAEYIYKASFVQDQEVNLAACMTQIMLNSQMKGE